MRPSIWWIAAIVVAVAGVGGLARGATPQSTGTGGGTSQSPAIVVTGAYVRQPASPDVAAAYFTVYNTTSVPDLLVSAASGAGEETTLHLEANGNMVDTPNGVTIPAHGSVEFTPTTGHVMIQNLIGTITAGQTVDIQLTFANAGEVVFSAPVIGIYATPPAGAAATTAPTVSTPPPAPTISATPPASPTAGATS